MSKKIFNLHAAFDTKIKSVDDSGEENLVIEGYANTTDKDRAGDIVLEDAWKKGGLDNYLQNPIILGFHQHDNPIGYMTNHAVNSKGLFISATISKAAGRVYDLIKQGVLRTFSIGFMIKDADYDSATDIFLIKDLELLEISVVSVPANQFSVFNVKKSFNDEDEFTKFKQEYSHTPEITISEEEEEMPLSKEELEKIKLDAIAEFKAEEARKKAEEDRIKTLAVEVGANEAEKLMAAVEAKIAEKDVSIGAALSAIEELKSELKEKSEELLTFQKNKMQFLDKNNSFGISNSEKDGAVILSKLMNKPIEELDYGKNIIQKSEGTHQNVTADWEQEFSTRLMDDINLRLIVEPLFTNIPMSTAKMQVPINPKAGYAQWINTIPAPTATSNTSTGADKNHQLSDITLTAYKLASKDRVSYEEEEDLIVPFLDVIRNAAVERVAYASDNALLVGVAGSASPSNADFTNNYPFDGLSELAANAGAEVPSDATATVLLLQQTRRLMGKYGLNPSDIVYIVSQDTYYDLLEDNDFRTLDMVGPNATILTGQVGSVNGSRVIVSGEFAASGAGKARAVVVNLRNYLKGTLRGLTVERAKNIEAQNNLIVVTRRFGMVELFNGSATESAVATLTWAT